MPRPSNTEKRQEEIVTGLMQVMSSRGYDQASIGAIAKAAGLSQGVVHYHFKSKQQILLRLVALLSATIRTRFESIVLASSSPEDKLWAYIDAHVALGAGADPEAVACWVYISAEAVRQPEVGELYRSVVKEDVRLLAQLLRETLASQNISTRPSKQMAAAIFAAIQGAYLLSAAAPETIPPGSAAGSIRNMAKGLLQSKGWTQ